MQRLDPVELEGWFAYWKLHPFGPMVENDRHAILCATVATYSFGGSRRVNPDDFRPRYGKATEDEPEALDPKEAARLAAAEAARWAALLNQTPQPSNEVAFGLDRQPGG